MIAKDGQTNPRTERAWPTVHLLPLPICRTYDAHGHLYSRDARLAPMSGHRSSAAAHGAASELPPSASDSNQPAIVLYGYADASMSLYFDGLPPAILQRLRIITPGPGGVALTEFADAAAVVLVREFERPSLAGTVERLRQVGIPIVYFTDDHLGVLRREVAAFTYYSDAHFTRFLAQCDRVLVSSPALREALRAFHPAVEIIDLALDATLDEPLPEIADSDAPLTVAVPGGPFRGEEFRQQIVPALEAIAANRPVTVVSRQGTLPLGSGVIYETIPNIASFRHFIQAWRQHRPALLLHAAGKTANARYKTPNALLVAHYLGAVPIVADDEPAYQRIGEDTGLLKAADTQQWIQQMLRAADPDTHAALRARLAAYCKTQFDGHAQASILSDLLERGAAIAPDERSRRLRLAQALTPADTRGRLFARFASRTLRTSARLSARLRRLLH